MNNIDRAFIRIAILYAIAGMIMGIYMGASNDHSLYPAHAHIQLLGFASLILYALIYRAWPQMAASRLARWHFWLTNAGTLITALAVSAINLGHAERAEPFAAAGSMLLLTGLLIFAVIVFRDPPAVKSPA